MSWATATWCSKARPGSWWTTPPSARNGWRSEPAGQAGVASFSPTMPATISAIQANRSGAALSPSRSEEHTSELQSLMRNSYAVFCLKKKKYKTTQRTSHQQDATSKQEKHTNNIAKQEQAQT